MACTGRQRNDLILVAIVCLFFMVIFIPPYLQMNSLPDIDSPVEKLEDDDDAVFTSHRRRNQEQISVVTDSGQRRTVMPSSTGAEDVTNAPSKDSQVRPKVVDLKCMW